MNVVGDNTNNGDQNVDTVILSLGLLRRGNAVTEESPGLNKNEILRGVYPDFRSGLRMTR